MSDKPCPTCDTFTMRASIGTGETFKVCADPYHGPLPEPYASDLARTFGPGPDAKALALRELGSLRDREGGD